MWSVARNAFREAVRDRVLYNLVLFVLLLTVGAIFLGAASASQGAKIIVDLGLSAMLLFGAFIAVFVGVGLVSKEIERRTLYVIFAKPVGRGQFLFGKLLAKVDGARMDTTPGGMRIEVADERDVDAARAAVRHGGARLVSVQPVRQSLEDLLVPEGPRAVHTD